MTRSPLQCCTSIIRSSALVQVSSSFSIGRTCAWPRRLPVTEMHFRHFHREFQKCVFAIFPARTIQQKTEKSHRDRNINSEQLEFECQLRKPIRGRIYELFNLGASSSQNLFQSLITNQDLLRLREDMWPNHKTLRKGWWCRAFATAINRQCPTCNRLWTTE